MNSIIPPRHQRTSKLNKFPFGVCYYPEHWNREWISDDAALMAKAEVNTVRMAEFAWTLMEPSRGTFDFSLFREAVETLEKQGIQTILCTPTATPPRWLTIEHPEMLRVNIDGVPYLHGNRQHCCTNNPGFRAESRRITQAMAEAFSDCPPVIGWQTDNEFYCHVSECYCGSCHAAFRDWLKDRYQNEIAQLNDAWGTAFWSQQYDTFDQVDIPRKDRRPAPVNPSALLDYHRFMSDSVKAFQKEQVDIIRKVNAAWWVTHNGIHSNIDYYRFTEDLDFLGVDVYPAFWGTRPWEFKGASELNEKCRQASGTYIVPEQCGGPGGQFDFLQSTPEKGRMRLWMYQSIAHGADGVLHFRWRTCRFGAEIHWHGILDHDNVPRRRYDEFSQEGRELKAIGPCILGTSRRVDVGISYGYDQDKAQAVMHMGRPKLDDQRELILAELMRKNIAVGYVNEADSYDGLKVLVVPSAIMMDSTIAAKLEAFVSDGGILLVTATTAQRDMFNRAIGETPPGLLRKLLGITVEEFGKTDHREMALAGEGFSLNSNYYEILNCEEAEAIAHWKFSRNVSVEAAHGEVGLSCNLFGKGKAFYLGTFMSEANAGPLLDLVCESADIKPMASGPDNVCVLERRSEERRLTFVLNFYPEVQHVRGLPKGMDLLTGEKCPGDLALEPFGVAIVES